MRSLMFLVPLLMAVGLLIAFGSSNFSPLDDVPAADRERASEEQAIRTLMGQLHEAWRRSDMAAFTAHFTKDADLMDRHGPWVRRRAEIAEHLTRAYAGDSRDYYQATGTEALFDAIQIITPDVALVHEQRGEAPRKAIATYVLAKQDGRWWVRSLDITPLDDPSGVPAAMLPARPRG